MLSFQRLEVYQRAIDFLALAIDIVNELPKGHAERADQLVRAAESVARNIADGAGRWSGADCAKHYKIARGEAMECAASLDVMKVRRVINAERYDDGIRLLEERGRDAHQDAVTSKRLVQTSRSPSPSRTTSRSRSRSTSTRATAATMQTRPRACP
jgi:four helix bundle protein